MARLEPVLKILVEFHVLFCKLTIVSRFFWDRNYGET